MKGSTVSVSPFIFIRTMEVNNEIYVDIQSPILANYIINKLTLHGISE